MGQFVCIMPCWHQGKKWRKGDLATFGEGEEPKSSKGKIVHFELVSPSAAVTTDEPRDHEPAVAVNEKKRRIK